MTTHLALVDGHDVADVGTFLGRARRLDVTEVRLQATGRVLAVTVCALAGSGLLAEGTVLGMRAFSLAEDASCDVVVSVEAVADRLARLRAEDVPPNAGPRVFALPPVPVVVAWAGLAPPRSGWEPVTTLPGAVIDDVARAGIAEVTASRLADVRETVWRRPLADTPLPAGAALAAHVLGFTGTESTVHRHGRWGRLSSPAGHVLTR